MIERYEGHKTHHTGVTAFEVGPNWIKLEFGGEWYLYDDEKPGKKHIAEMKRLAKSGNGLTTYVNQNVRENYKRKL